MGEKQIGVGIIGCGTILQAHLQAIKANQDLKLIGVTDYDYGKAVQCAETSQCKVYRNNLSLIEDPKVQLVVLLTPPIYHKESIRACALNGKHVLAEKPIGTRIEDVNSAVEICKEKNVVFSVVSQHRFDPASRIAKDKIERQAFGKLRGANCIVNWYRKDEYYNNTWRRTSELAGGGVLPIQAIHTIDLMLWLMGEVDSVMAYTSKDGHDDIEVEDSAMACIKFKNGSLAVISATTCAYPGYPARLDIFGMDGSISIEGDEVTFYHSRKEGDSPVAVGVKGEVVSSPDKVSVESINAQYADVIYSILNQTEPLVTGDEARKVFKLIDAIYQSSRLGKEIKL
jgi:UDP-N-acetyl-2-amino-2-deoxyglucuronate dehydrogenase